VSDRLQLGLVGAGPWAHLFTAPMLAASTDADFVGVWARRPEAAHELAAAHGTVAFEDLAALFDRCEAVTFSVPPSVQAELAAKAASAGTAVLLDKPVGASLAQAEALAEAIDRAGVVSQVILTNRYLDSMRSFLDAAARFDAYGGRASFFGNGCMEGTYFATPWRLAEGGLLDLGPHVLDALDAALGPIQAVEARGDVHRLVLLECEHAGGRVSQAALSATSNQAGALAVELCGLDGRLALDLAARTPEQADADSAIARARIVAELASCVRDGTRHPLDVHRGLHLQRLIDDAAAQLRRGRPVAPAG
jgi:predicted dehydrogenase